MNEQQQHHINKKEKHSKSNVLNVGDMILIKGEENVPPTQWRIGKINKLIIGKDVHIRGVELVVISKTGEKTVCQRPIQKLILYEIDHELYEMTMNSMK